MNDIFCSDFSIHPFALMLSQRRRTEHVWKGVTELVLKKEEDEEKDGMKKGFQRQSLLKHFVNTLFVLFSPETETDKVDNYYDA